ncbi:type II toxin-antitoxin system RelB/DinJ family antitoxin [Morganella morganii]|uniref:type II toxin-antitoxin system RelB/DinJ family antitoxin n=1 Tax=Morganella morganii TaxID=582 RepID=UPI00339D0EF4
MSKVEYVRAKIDPKLKAEAIETLESMGLTVSDAIRMLMIQIVEQKAMPFSVKSTPYRHAARTRAAIEELECGKGKKFDSISDLMADLQDGKDD